MEDEKRLIEIRDKYKSGELLTGEVKQILVDVLTELVVNHQEARKGVTEEVVDAFLAVRKLVY